MSQLARILGPALVVFGLVAMLLADRGNGVSPIASTDKLTVLMVEQPNQRHTIPAGQREALTSVPLKQYLNEVGADWEILSDDAVTSDLSEAMKAAYAVPRVSLPWLVVAGPHGGVSAPLESVEQVKRAVEGAK